MSTHITPLYAAILGLGLAALGIRAITLVGRNANDEGDNPEHQKAMQAFENFTEYVPLAMLLIWFLELRTGSGWSIHTFCMVFLAGRLIHAVGVSRINEKPVFRVTGMAYVLGDYCGCGAYFDRLVRPLSTIVCSYKK